MAGRPGKSKERQATTPYSDHTVERFFSEFKNYFPTSSFLKVGMAKVSA